MKKSHLYEAILLVNRGVDEAVRGLERLNGARDSQLNSACFDEELILSRGPPRTTQFLVCSALQHSELRDSAHFESRYHEFEKNTVDEVQVYHDVKAVEDRRRVEGKLPKVRFFTQEEQR